MAMYKITFRDYIRFLDRIRPLEIEQDALDMNNKLHVRRSRVIDAKLEVIYKEIEQLHLDYDKVHLKHMRLVKSIASFTKEVK